MDNYILILLIAATISVSSSVLVILTLVCFRDMRNKPFMRIIAYISVCDVLANVAYLVPWRTSASDWWCSAQGIMNLWFYPSSWMWTVCLMMLLSELGMEGKICTNLLHIHGICWLLPCFLAFGSLLFSPFGDRDGLLSFDICSNSLDLASEIYHAVAYYGLLIGCFTYMVILQRKLNFLEYNKSECTLNPSFLASRVALQYYSPALVLCWTPHLVTIILAYFPELNGNNFEIAYLIGDMFKIFHGTVTMIIFFLKSSEARLQWWHLYHRIVQHLWSHGNIHHMDDFYGGRNHSIEINSTNNVLLSSV